MIVDAHVHVWEPRSERYPWQPLGNLQPDFAWTAEEQVEAMRRVGIDAAILVQMSWYGYDNAYILDCAQHYPYRFAVVGMVDPASETIEADIERLVLQGLGGFRLMPRMRPDIPWYSERLWRKADAMGLVLTLLVSPEQAVEAEPVIARYSNVKVVIDHLARPDMESDPQRPLFRKLLAMARHPNLFLKVSALAAISRAGPPYADVVGDVHCALEAFGAERLMWGTDYAMSRGLISMEGAMELIEQSLAGATPEERAAVLGGTAARLWYLV